MEIELTPVQKKILKDIEGAKGLVASLTAKLEETGISYIKAKRSLGLAPKPGPKPDSIGAGEFYGRFKEACKTAFAPEGEGGLLSIPAIEALGGKKTRLRDFVKKGFIIETERHDQTGFGVYVYTPGNPPPGRSLPSQGPMTDEERAFFGTLHMAGEARESIGPRRFQVLIGQGDVVKYPGAPHGLWGVPGLDPAKAAPQKVAEPRKPRESVESFENALVEEAPVAVPRRQAMLFN